MQLASAPFTTPWPATAQAILSNEQLAALARQVADLMMAAGTQAPPPQPPPPPPPEPSPAPPPEPAPAPQPAEPETKKDKKKKKKKKAKQSGEAAPLDQKFEWTVPPPAEHDKAWCHTWMSDSNDDGSCFALVHHHCVDGFKDESRIPAAVRAVKDSALKQVYDVQKACTHDNNKKVPQYKCFTKPPATWTSVCVARPDLAGKGKCKKVSKDEWRMWVQGEDPERKSDCQFSSLYIKSHFRGPKIQGQYTGKHGRG